MPPALFRSVPMLAAGLLVAGCSVSTPPSVAIGSRPAEPLAAVRIEPPAPGDAAAARFTATLARALPRHGVTVADSSPTVLSVALSQRPAAIGVTAKPGEAWLSLPRKRGPLDACRAQRVAVRVVARHEARAEPSFAARGGFDYCALDPADLDALAEQFAAALAQG